MVLGAILLIKGGGIGFDQTDEELTIDTGGDAPAAEYHDHHDRGGAVHQRAARRR